MDIKTEVQLQFRTIADMSSHVRRLVAPLGRISSNLRIENINRPEERVLIIFDEERHFLSLDWSMLALVLEGGRADLKKRDGRLRFSFDLFEKVKELDGYGGLKQAIVYAWSLVPNRHSNPRAFRDTYLGENAGLDHLKPSDVSVTLEGELERELEYSISFGPFAPSKDIDRHNLVTFRNEERSFAEELESTEGLLTRVQLTASGDRIESKDIIGMIKKSDELRESLFQRS